ncbi:nodulation receptor kinase-like [Aristolochia californica]|uniref:nodulation receptor kinase-like n=1 Tax=Aristolochia californica TaxID=171875 RepID=UPI0035E18065
MGARLRSPASAIPTVSAKVKPDRQGTAPSSKSILIVSNLQEIEAENTNFGFHAEFVSLECCSVSKRTDPATNIIWIPDDGWLLSNGTCRYLSPLALNDSSNNAFRILDEDSASKWCYNFSTINQHDYLVRATFLHGSFMQSFNGTAFNISIGATLFGQETPVIDREEEVEVEAIVRAPNRYLNFCLVKVNGNPYISKVELRPLSDYHYLNENQNVILKLLSRVDAGNTREQIRYPTDPNDRIWSIDKKPGGNLVQPSSNSISIYPTNSSNVPIKVLETAVTHTERLQFLFNDSGYIHYERFHVCLYFLELDPLIAVGQRVFDIYANGEKMRGSFDIQENNTSNYKELVFAVPNNNGFLNITLLKNSTIPLAAGPLCNAYEIFRVHEIVPGTLQKDVDAIVEVRDEIRVANPENDLLRSWSGDPCLPTSWKGLSCQPNNGIYLIMGMDLSSSRLQGSLPMAISKLTELQELNVHNNNFSGSVPESFSSLQHLTKLSFGCNLLSSNQLPPGLDQSKLSTDYGKCDGQVSSNPQSPRNYIIGSVLGASVFFLLVGVIFSCFYRRVRRVDVTQTAMQNNAVFSIPSVDDFDKKPIFIQAFTLECIEAATNKYKTMIGEGGFGTVFRGTLPEGQDVAVKVRSATSTQGTREFENELNLLSAIQHENLVPLLGYCCENDQQILVYPFMSNGSLQDRLYGNASKRKPLDWPTRLSVALGAARGLLYLHTFAGRSVIHRDVKSSNILLDHSMCAKVADFGFSKYAPQEGDSGVSLEVRGTAGYLDPEYYTTQQLSAKSDVFSFGVVLLEIITGREPLNIHRPRNEWSLVEWAKPFIRESRIEEIVDPNIKSGYHAEAMWRVVEVALCCIEPFATYRPCMADIVRELEDALIIENNASEYMKSIESLGGSNRYFSIERKVLAAPSTPTPSEPSPLLLSQSIVPPQPR